MQPAATMVWWSARCGQMPLPKSSACIELVGRAGCMTMCTPHGWGECSGVHGACVVTLLRPFAVGTQQMDNPTWVLKVHMIDSSRASAKGPEGTSVSRDYGQQLVQQLVGCNWHVRCTKQGETASSRCTVLSSHVARDARCKQVVEARATHDSCHMEHMLRCGRSGRMRLSITCQEGGHARAWVELLAGEA
jgi:hypothetical protein